MQPASGVGAAPVSIAMENCILEHLGTSGAGQVAAHCLTDALLRLERLAEEDSHSGYPLVLSANHPQVSGYVLRKDLLKALGK